MKTSEAGFDLIKKFEGLHKLRTDGLIESYLDPVGIWTIGYGSIRLNGRPVRRGDIISLKLAQELLEEEVAGFEKDVERLVKVPLNQNQFDALVSLCYNIGAGGFAGSTARRLLNEANYQGCADAMLLWNKGTINGRLVELPGLTRRRKAERDLFLKPVATQPTPGPTISTGRPYEPCPVPMLISGSYRLGDRGDGVYLIQCALIGLGFLAKPKDGELVGDYFNEHVEFAVKQFQAYAKLNIDGIVGPRTRGEMEIALLSARKPKPPVDNSVATLRCIEGQWHDGAWAGLKVFNLGIGSDTFRVASGARGRQTLRKPQDPRSVPGSLEPIPQGRYRIGDIAFANGKDNYEGSFGAGLGPVWVGLDAEFSDDRGAFGIHQDHNIGGSPGSAGCVVMRDVADLKRLVAALRKWDPKTLWVDYKL